MPPPQRIRRYKLPNGCIFIVEEGTKGRVDRFRLGDDPGKTPIIGRQNALFPYFVGIWGLLLQHGYREE